MAIAPGINQWLPLPYGEFRLFLREPLEFQRRARARFGDVVRFKIGPVLGHFVYHPDHVRHVLFEQQKNYLRGWHYRLTQKILGDNLVVSEGDYWMRQRRLAQPAFHRQRLMGYLGTMADATAQMLARWRAHASAGTQIDVRAEMARLALAIAGRTLFSRDMSNETDAIGQTFSVVGHALEHRFNKPISSMPFWVPTPANVRFWRAVRTMNEIVLELIRQRRRDGRNHGDLLSMLMSARDDETGATMTDEQLRSEALTFLIAEHETTATALIWTWYFLTSFPWAQERLRAEACAVFGEGAPTMADVVRLDYTRMVIEESMRLYPPIWAVPRQAQVDDEIGGYHIPAKSTVALCPFITHRHPAFWHNPDAFEPERFSAEKSAARPKGAYFPFLGGAHQCIGNEFAMLETRLIVAMIAREFELTLSPGQNIQPKASLVLRTNGPVRVSLKPLSAPALAASSDHVGKTLDTQPSLD